MDFAGFDRKLNQVNERLRSALVGVAVERFKGTLRLRATLPPKPGSNRQRPYQQRISIGSPANLAGLREAEKLARLAGAQLAAREFEWNDWGVTPTGDSWPCEMAIAKFQRHYLAQGGNPETWQGDYMKVLKRLPPDAPLTGELLEAFVCGTTPNTKARTRACMAAGALARFAAVDFDPKPYKGTYSPRQVAPRRLPSNEEVARWREQIRNPAWRWIYGMMATYGLRNHEVFKLDLGEFPVVKVLESTKTGEREVWPCFPEWAEWWELGDRILPGVNLERSNSKLGHSVTEYFSDLLPFAPYNLRHCWAVRTIEFGWPDALAAAQMGHSLDVHNRTYQRWLTKRHHQQVYDLLVKREDRPRPPTVTQSDDSLHTSSIKKK
jgi:hypothetical protein